MNKLLALIVGIVVGGLGVYLGSPATVHVGQETVQLKESRAYVLVMNTIGDLRGNLRCGITGLSFYWVPYKSLMYQSTVMEGVIVSNYAVEGLKRLNPAIAYTIAEPVSLKYGHTGNKKLEYPLRTLEDGEFVIAH